MLRWADKACPARTSSGHIFGAQLAKERRKAAARWPLIDLVGISAQSFEGREARPRHGRNPAGWIVWCTMYG